MIITNEIVEHFNKRTNTHIKLVYEFYNKIIAAIILPISSNMLNHDASKFLPPEFEPYIKLTWEYYCKDNNLSIDLSNEERDEIRKATYHHVKSNMHHPEFWDKSTTIEVINNKNRDANPNNSVKAYSMPYKYIIEMVADWCAMSKERNNTPKEWAIKVIGVRYLFNQEQINFIYKVIDIAWN